MTTQESLPTRCNWFSRLLLMAWAVGVAEGAEPSVTVQREGGNAVVNFMGRLQSAGNVQGPYANVPGALSPYLTSTASAPQRYWRSVLNDVRSIAAGDFFTLAIRKDGSLWAWGYNPYGQLGTGATNSMLEPAREPVRVGTNTNWRTVSGGAGSYHACAIRDDGTLWSWGDNRFGQLGQGAAAPVIVLEPRQVGTNSDWKSISLSGGGGDTPGRNDAYLASGHSLALREEGTLWCWGNNQHGQLGLGTLAEGAPYGMAEPTQVGTDADWSAVAAGGLHSVATRTDGSLWVWGDNGNLQLQGLYPPSSQTEDVVYQPERYALTNVWGAVSGGGYFSMALGSDGSLWAWGNDQGGQLGLPTTANEYNYRGRAGGGWGPGQVGTNSNWLTVAAGRAHTVALRDDGTLWASGDNSLGQIAQPTYWEPAPIAGDDWGLPGHPGP